LFLICFPPGGPNRPPAAERFPAISRHFPIPHDEDTTMTFAKLSSTALAAGLVAGAALFAGGAHAQGVAKFSGATAFSINQARALALLCNNASGLADIYKSNNNSTNNLGNAFTVKCSVNFQNGGGADEARINVAGGSFSAVLNRTGNDNATPVTLLSAALCAAQGTTVNVGAGTGPLNWINNATIRLFHCPAAAAVQADTTDGGVLDVEGSIFTANGLVTPSQVNAATDYLPSGFLQAFAFPLSRDLYNAMQAHQTAQGRLPASCATVVNIAGVDTFTASGSTLPECQPSVNRSSIASMMVAGNNDVKRAGANHFIGGTAALKNDLPANRAISPDMALNSRFVYCRRPATSGTQAAAQLYFLNTPHRLGLTRRSAGGRGPAHRSGHRQPGQHLPCDDQQRHRRRAHLPEQRRGGHQFLGWRGFGGEQPARWHRHLPLRQAQRRAHRRWRGGLGADGRGHCRPLRLRVRSHQVLPGRCVLAAARRDRQRAAGRRLDAGPVPAQRGAVHARRPGHRSAARQAVIRA
jgi:hypothetical protein